jgi:hypothetical protein
VQDFRVCYFEAHPADKTLPLCDQRLGVTWSGAPPVEIAVTRFGATGFFRAACADAVGRGSTSIFAVSADTWSDRFIRRA